MALYDHKWTLLGHRAAITLVLVLALGVWGCEDDEPIDAQDVGEDVEEREPGPEHEGIYSFANGCYTMDGAEPGSATALFLKSTADGGEFAFSGVDESSASRLLMRASDLGTYLLYDEEEQYLVVEEEDFLRKSEFLSDIFLLDDSYLPGAQWELQISANDGTRFQFYHLRTESYLATEGLTEDAEQAAVITFYPAEDCAEFPELSLDAEGEITPRQHDDGSVYGFVDTHSHIMSNFGFGGAGMFHGAAFHPFGVEHALPSCEMFHGHEGRSDLFGYGFDESNDATETELLAAFVNGETADFNHHTDGYPTFTDWPSAHDSATHQTQYYRWIQRAYLSGLRLIVNHATSNQIICELLAGSDAQPTRYSCNDMVAVDRTIEETRRMERYIDAQEGGPGEGWFRIVESPQEAREVINEGKLAVVLGIEVSNLFDCFLVPPGGGQRCTEQQVIDALDHYEEQGVRVIFPVHKFDNAFSAGDGHRDIIELGNFAQTGHNSNFTEDCPDLDSIFDSGNVTFADLNAPREDYFSEPPHDMSGFAADPINTLLEHASVFVGGSLEGDYCQNAGLTDLGEFLIEELMRRGIVIELDHLPRRSYQRAFEILEENQYPGVGTHGNNNGGELYAIGGVSKFNFGRCNDPDSPGSRANHLRNRLALLESHDQFVAEGFGFDLNGFAGAQGPRFGDESVCNTPQENPVTYPFESLSGDITFTAPLLGERVFDFNTGGFAHIGLLPELLEDVRKDGATDEDFDALFKSAEGYLRMWERSQERGAALSGQ